MSIELQAVLGTSLILFLLLLMQGTLVPLNQGFGWGLGSRDAKQDLTDMQGRASRTIANHIEGMMLFVPLVLVIELAELSSGLTAIGAGIYLAGRAAFAPIYLMGIAYLRSLAWGISVIGLLMLGYVAAAALV